MDFIDKYNNYLVETMSDYKKGEHIYNIYGFENNLGLIWIKNNRTKNHEVLLIKHTKKGRRILDKNNSIHLNLNLNDIYVLLGKVQRGGI